MSEHVRSNSKAKSGQACVDIPITLLHAIQHLMGTYLTLHVYITGARADTVHNMPYGGVVRWVQQTMALGAAHVNLFHIA